MSHFKWIYDWAWTENVCNKLDWKLCVQNVNNLKEIEQFLEQHMYVHECIYACFIITKT